MGKDSPFHLSAPRMHPHGVRIMDDDREALPRTGTVPTPELEVLERAHARLEADSRLEPSSRRLTLVFADGILTVDGEVEDLASKKRALEDVASVDDIRWVVDHVRVRPSVYMQDGELRDHVRDALIQEKEFDECRLLAAHDGVDERDRDPVDARGSIRVRVMGGVVTLEGEVPSWSHRRLAGVLAWWIPGTRDVENRLGVEPPETDNDGEITDAVRLALEREPLIDADQIRVSTREGRVTLEGTVASEEQRRTAERDAWFVLGVKGVANGIFATK
jgi:osmotically-inducible protein OsmY